MEEQYKKDEVDMNLGNLLWNFQPNKYFTFIILFISAILT